ncbi:hypothetical protein [Kribbella sindirgiensis]|uniref:Secreted protein n=1 Tax=Kribbella sindirgiensis TaxID=1124744 RepID=A0A4R0IYP5_9ACTN|nr:hypothetical protein [Kribbella sindirgiensis]TCC36748.1 hypothetical protein E0H50_08565 [Kribbella sindirgiensis]
MNKQRMIGIAAAGVLAAGGVTVVTTMTGPAPASAADNCHYEPSGNPWKHVCLKGPHRFKSQCNMMRNDMIRRGYGVLSCRWETYNAGSGWYFWYGSN